MPNTANKGYTVPTYNSETNTWGTDVNNNFTSIVDANLGGVVTVALSNANVTLSAAQAQNLVVYLTGSLGANLTIYSPCVGFFWVINNTTGNYFVQIRSSIGGSPFGSFVLLPQGSRTLLCNDAATGIALGAPTNTGVPSGVIQAYAGLSAPGGWLLCYGQAVNRQLYASLFGVLGTLYGAGDGSTTFNVPDLRGRSLAGLDNMGGSDAGRLDWTNALGTVGGEQYHTLTANELASHTHTATASDSGHTHPGPADNGGGGVNGLFYGSGRSSGSTGTGYANISVSVANSGGNIAHNNMSPTMLLNWIIKI